jgi:hypothetical protein
MDPRASRASGWRTYAGLVLALGGVFAVIDGLTAVYKSTFFTTNAVFVFSDLRAWGWITFAVGALAVAAGFAVFSGREWARWTGIAIAGLGAIGQMLFAQAYPLWSLMIMGVYLLAIYGLAVHGVRDSAADARASSRHESATATPERPSSAPGVSDASAREHEQERRAA